jgi:hypothetical protein
VSFTLVVDGERRAVGLSGSRTLAEIVSGEEYGRLRSGELAAFSELGGLMDLSSPLTEGQVVTLRPLLREDLEALGFWLGEGPPP